MDCSFTARYESEWRNDEKSGKGKEVWADGTHFAGSYMKGPRAQDVDSTRRFDLIKKQAVPSTT
eukprot:143662-Amphidinium_carterae.1